MVTRSTQRAQTSSVQLISAHYYQILLAFALGIDVWKIEGQCPSGISPTFNYLFLGPLSTFPEMFI